MKSAKRRWVSLRFSEKLIFLFFILLYIWEMWYVLTMR